MKDAARRMLSKRCWSAFSLLIWGLPLLALGLRSIPAKAQGAVVLVGSGSSVPAPLYNRWTQEYGKRASNIQMRYPPVGTSEGIKQISHGAGDFGAGEAQLTEKERKEAAWSNRRWFSSDWFLSTPFDVHQELRLSGEVLAGIFLGDVKVWNAPQIAKRNLGVHLPNLPIQVVNRPAGKGSIYVFTEFLSEGEFKVPRRGWNQSFAQVASGDACGTQFRYGRTGEKTLRVQSGTSSINMRRRAVFHRLRC